VPSAKESFFFLVSCRGRLLGDDILRVDRVPVFVGDAHAQLLVVRIQKVLAMAGRVHLAHVHFDSVQLAVRASSKPRLPSGPALANHVRLGEQVMTALLARIPACPHVPEGKGQRGQEPADDFAQKHLSGGQMAP